jgi:acyl-CoA thioesterase-1
MGPGGKNLASPDDPTSFQQVPIEEYARNIVTLAERLKATGAKVIWRETTPVPEGAAGRVPGDAAKYNRAAAKAIAEVGGIETDPFFEFAQSNAEHQRPKNVHYTPKGSQLLGRHVAEVIEAALAARSR